MTRRDKSRTSLVLFQLTLLIRRMRRPWTVCCVCRHKTRVNLQIRAHITTYYHLQIVITNDHRLGMALVMDGRLWCLIRSPPGAGCVAFLVRRIGCQPESESVPVQQQHEQKRVHHFLVIIFSDPRSRQCPRCCHLRTREGGSLLISSAPVMATMRCDDEDAGGDLAWPGWCIKSSACCLASVSSRGSMNGWLGRRRRMGMRSHS